MKLVNQLQTIAAQTATTAESLMEQTKDWQLIQRYLKNRLDEIKLSAKQKKKLERYQYAYAQCSSGRYTDAEVASMLTKTFDIEIRQANVDMNCMREIYSNVVSIHKRFEISQQLLLNKKMLLKAAQMDDLKSYSMLEKNRQSLLAMIEDDENREALDFEGHTFETTFDPALIGGKQVDIKELMAVINEGRSSKLNIDGLDILPFEDLIPEPDEEEDSL